MRRDDICLTEMLEAAEQLIKLLERPDAEVLFHGDRSFRHSVFFEFVVLGEQVGTVTPELQVRHPEVSWRQIAAFRHRVAHGYFDLSLSVVWEIWNRQIPELREQLRSILAVEFPDR